MLYYEIIQVNRKLCKIPQNDTLTEISLWTALLQTALSPPSILFYNIFSQLAAT